MGHNLSLDVNWLYQTLLNFFSIQGVASALLVTFALVLGVASFRAILNLFK